MTLLYVSSILSWLVAPLSAIRPPASSHCKTTPYSPSWPSEVRWAGLNHTVGGQLLAPKPPAAACHHDQPSYNAEECAKIAQQWTTYAFHASDAVSVMWDNWTNDTCLPESNVRCSGTGYPAYVINATSAEDVKAGIEFAKKNNIRLNIKSSGHDFYGRSNAPFSLSVWMHGFRSLKYHPSSYIISSGRSLKGNHITVGGGTEMSAIYETTAQYNQTIVGGGAETVSVGGYLGGGGHGLLGPKHGMAADNVVEAQIVTADGSIRTVNEDCNADLFWAIRGGGSSTFGAMISATIRTHDSPKIVSSKWTVRADVNAPFISDLIAHVWSYYPQFMDRGMSGYTYATSGLAGIIPGVLGPVAGVLGSVVVQDTMDVDVIAKLTKPMFESIEKRWPGQVQVSVEPGTSYASFVDWYKINHDTGSAGVNAILVSRLLDRKSLTQNDDYLSTAVKAALGPTNYTTAHMLGLGSRVSDDVRNVVSNAVNPAWRRAIVHSIANLGFQSFNSTAKEEAYSKLDASYQPMREISPDMGAYINEGSKHEKDFQETFWGDNYPRLLSLKRKYDPEDVFWCNPCVGNERWKESDEGKLCRI